MLWIQPAFAAHGGTDPNVVSLTPDSVTAPYDTCGLFVATAETSGAVAEGETLVVRAEGFDADSSSPGQELADASIAFCDPDGPGPASSLPAGETPAADCDDTDNLANGGNDNCIDTGIGSNAQAPAIVQVSCTTDANGQCQFGLFASDLNSNGASGSVTAWFDVDGDGGRDLNEPFDSSDVTIPAGPAPPAGCELDLTTNVLTLQLTQGEEAHVFRDASGISLNGAFCGQAEGLVILGTEGDEKLHFVLGGDGFFMFPIEVDLLEGDDKVILDGTPFFDGFLARSVGEGVKAQFGFTNTLTTTINSVESYAAFGGDNFDLFTFSGSTRFGRSNSPVTVPVALFGENGRDQLSGGSGPDLISGGPETGFLLGGDGADEILGGDSRDSIFAEEGDDRIDAGAGRDRVQGGPGLDVVSGGDGPDGLTGGSGDDDMSGGLGSDWLNGGPGADVMRGNGSADPSDDSRNSLYGASGDDELVGGSGRDWLTGANGHDLLRGEGGPDVLWGSLGRDVLFGGLDDDGLFGGRGRDDLFGNPGNDEISGGRSDDYLVGNDGEDQLEGHSGNDSIFAGNPSATGATEASGPANDIAAGGHGKDFIAGGDGADFLNGGPGHDSVMGEAGDDSLTDRAGHNSLYGGPGNDHVEGGDAPDYIVGNDGQDSLFGGDDSDEIFGGNPSVTTGQESSGPASDQIFGGAGADFLAGNDGPDFIWGEADPDQILGDAGDDVAAGGEGDDALLGGTGNDHFFEDAVPNGRDNFSGGSGNDVVDYSGRLGAVQVSFDDIANDGEVVSGVVEGDNVGSDVQGFLDQTGLLRCAAGLVANQGLCAEPSLAPSPAPTPPAVVHALAVASAGGGSGVVTSTPSGIQCGAACIATFSPGTTVQLFATPLAGSTFEGWGGACSGRTTCVVTMSGPMAVSATFVRIPDRLTLGVSVEGSGGGRVVSSPPGIDCSTACEAEFDDGSDVTLTATAAPGSRFGGWSGSCSGSQRTCTVTLDDAASVAATFLLVVPGDGFIEYLPARDAFRVEVASEHDACMVGRAVRLFRRNAAGTRRIGSDVSDQMGRAIFTGFPNPSGRFFARAVEVSATRADGSSVICSAVATGMISPRRR